MADGATTEEEERRRGYAAAKAWLVDGVSETERASLAAALSSGLTIVASRPLYPTLVEALGVDRVPLGVEVDFSSTAWLRGFRQAVVEELAEPG